MNVLAIDPGGSGAIVLAIEGRPLQIWKMPDTCGDLVSVFKEIKAIGEEEFELPTVLLERVGGFIKGVPSPGSAMFKFGQNYGQLEALSMSIGFPLVLVSPAAWQKAVGINPIPDEKKQDHKNRLKALAQRLYPKQKVTLWNCDALLIVSAVPNLKLPATQPKD